MKEVQSTDETVAIVLKYVLEHPDTALIVTADHETGNTTLKSGWETDFNRITAGSGNHSDQLVPVFAIGKGTEALNSLAQASGELYLPQASTRLQEKSSRDGKGCKFKSNRKKSDFFPRS